MEGPFYVKRVLTGLALVLLSSCSSQTRTSVETAHPLTSQNTERFQKSGTIVLSRSVPSAQLVDAQSSLLGFLPATQRGNWLAVERANRIIKLMNGEDVVLQTQALEGVEQLPPGNYSIMLKQRSALWYAPDEYFVSRGIATPPEGSKERLLRGALGDFVLFIDEQHPLHEGPVWTSEIGGVRMEEADISRIYYQLEVGSLVTVE